MNYIEIARNLAKEAHKNQKRRDGKSYFTHVEAVAKIVDEDWFDLMPSSMDSTWNKEKDKVVAAAYLHDVIEDTQLCLDDLVKAGLTVMTVELVETLTRKKDENYFDFIMRIHDSGAFSVGARAIKVADIQHNLSDNLDEGSMKDKYRLAQYILRPKI